MMDFFERIVFDAEPSVSFYCVFLTDGSEKYAFQIFFSKPELLRYLRKMLLEEWKSLNLQFLLRELDKGIPNRFSLRSGLEHLYYIKISTKVGIQKINSQLINTFVSEYFYEGYSRQ